MFQTKKREVAKNAEKHITTEMRKAPVLGYPKSASQVFLKPTKIKNPLPDHI